MRDMLWMMKTQCEDEIIDWLQEQYPIDENSARSVFEIFRQQIDYLGEDSVPTDWRIVIEEGLDLKKERWVYYFLTYYGIRFNDGLSRMVAYLISKEKTTKVYVSITDSGFMISLPKYMRVNIKQIFASITEENCIRLLEKAIEDTQLLKSVFRINACRSFMILRCYMGRRKSARRQQFSADILINFARNLDKFAIFRESCREIIEDRFEAENITGILQGIQFGEIDVVLKETDSPSPMAFGIATLGAGDVIFADDKLALLKEFHRNVIETTGLKA
jgi:ATP-dependent Lhr-like helicase